MFSAALLDLSASPQVKTWHKIIQYHISGEIGYSILKYVFAIFSQSRNLLFIIYTNLDISFFAGHRRHRLSAEHHRQGQGAHQEALQGQPSREARLPEGRHQGHPEAQVSRGVELLGAHAYDLSAS